MTFIICTALVVIGYIVAKCLDNAVKHQHRHKWWTQGITEVPVYFNGGDIPTRYESHVSMSCEGCGEKKIEILNGAWKDD